jgi:crotonobetainyl-CoA:carnitine CoA-transferase CaiB-like acyl-CoA transferase
MIFQNRAINKIRGGIIMAKQKAGQQDGGAIWESLVDESARDPRNLPLDGIRVVRLGQSRAGNFLSRLLRDQGALVVEAAERSPGQVLAQSARIVINDLGRGAAPDKGLDFDSLAASNPNLIYCSLVGFPAGGPDDLPGLPDAPIAAALGLNRHAGDVPEQEPLPIPSFFGAVLSATYIGCALLPKDGQEPSPQFIEVPLFSAALNLLARELVTIEDERYPDPSRVNARLPNADIYKCADGEYLQPHGTFPHFVEILCAVGGHPEWAADAIPGIRRLPNKEARAMWSERFRTMFLEKTAAEWERLLNEAKGSGTVCRRHSEWESEPHAREAGIFVDTDAGLKVGPGVFVRANERPDGAAADSLPLPSGRKSRAGGSVETLPLAGLKVVDFCIVIAGPTCGRVLADLGAEVVKIDEAARDFGPYLWLDVNRGKRSIVLDLKKSEAREIAQTLVSSADIVLENFRKGKIDSFGLGYDDLVKLRPELVYASLNCFDREGPWSTRAGWEHNAQAAAGMQWARSRDGVPRQVPFPINDYATGCLGALGVVMALVRRETTGLGSHVRASLARSATFVQKNVFETDDSISTLTNAQSHQCADGWVTAWLPSEMNETQGKVVADWAKTASDQTCESAVASLTAAGLIAAVERRVRDLLGDAWMKDLGLLAHWNHPTLGPIVVATPHGKATGFKTYHSAPAPAPGAQSVEILAEFGYGAKSNDLLASGAVEADLPIFG